MPLAQGTATRGLLYICFKVAAAQACWLSYCCSVMSMIYWMAFKPSWCWRHSRSQQWMVFGENQTVILPQFTSFSITCCALFASTNAGKQLRHTQSCLRFDLTCGVIQKGTDAICYRSPCASCGITLVLFLKLIRLHAGLQDHQAV